MIDGSQEVTTSDSTPGLAAAQAAATQLGTQYTDPNLTGEQRAQVRAEMFQAVGEVRRIKQASQPTPDERALLDHSVTDGLRQLMNDAMDAVGVRPEPSRPTASYGAPNIGTDWRDAWDDIPIAANKAFGEA
jgi:hypothetical protein